ncbi:MAG: ROK family protein [Chloroflexi bacterium]|nr:ROK family protein [Chloroflexota bacterium]MBU1752078.1 ROK family protein [Chloroflexota bacterium]
MSTDLFVGIDLGGTKINTVLVDPSGRILNQDYRETQAREGPDAVIERMLDAAFRVMAGANVLSTQVRAVGVGAPGPIDIRVGMVGSPPNLPGWFNVPLGHRIASALEIPTFLENDANAAALGEHRFGAGRGTRHMVYVTVSTGIGGGFILDGKLYSGATGGAAEVGHVTILPHGPHCGCGRRGCLEALASGTAIAREGAELLMRGVPTRIAELAGGDPGRVSAKMVAQAAAEGDVEAQEIIDEAMMYLGLGMANLVNLINPEMMVIGGGLANMGDVLLDPVRRTIHRRAFRTAADAVRVVRAELGDNVGALGAAAVAMAAVK